MLNRPEITKITNVSFNFIKPGAKIKVHLLSKVQFRDAGWQDVPGELDGRGQFDESDVVMVGDRFVVEVGDDGFHLVHSFSTFICQRVKLTLMHRTDLYLIRVFLNALNVL